MDNNVEKQIKEVLSSVFEVHVREIDADASPHTIVKWDSLNHMKMIVALEEEFSIENLKKSIWSSIANDICVHIVDDHGSIIEKFAIQSGEWITTKQN